MENIILMKRSKELEDLSESLGFKKTLFLEDFVLLKEDSKKELLKKIKKAKSEQKFVICELKSEELLRFVLEKTPADLVIGMEKINPKDSLHFVRGGLDQITCKIAADKDKIIGFSFNDILQAKERGKLMARMIFNLKLCRKYKVEVLFSNFSTTKMEMRSAPDLAAVLRVLSSG